ncbi:MAG: M3 family metallopeptidase [Pseudomonadota bacterium]
MNNLPQYSQLQPEHVEDNINQLLIRNLQRTNELIAGLKTPTWHNLIEPLAIWDDELERAWSPVSHLNAVCNNPALRTAYHACLPALSDYATELGQHAGLHQAVQQLAEQADALNASQRKVLADKLRDFRLSGVSLPPEPRQRYKQIAQRLSELTSQFADHVLDATNAWYKPIDQVAALTGLPDSAIALTAQTAQQRGQDGWGLTLDYPLYQPVLAYAQDRALRQELYTAYQTRASDQGPHDPAYDNTPVMEQILALRHEQANLLGFAQYADYSLTTKMAESADAVTDFLHELAMRCRPQAERDLAELRQFAADTDGITDFSPWDQAYYTEKLREQRYQLSEEALKPYFPVEQVITGLFEVAQRLYGIQITPVDGVDIWHPEVRFYAIQDADQNLCGHFYLDLYARPNKRGGAWMDGCQSRFVTHEHHQDPVAYLVCNFTPPVAGQPTLLTHIEVETLFHEFGHGLHHLLTRIDYPDIAGINGVAWDAVELPSQFMENFCWQREALDLFARHHLTDEPLPDALFARMSAAKNFQSALAMLRQIEFALFDLELHRSYDPAQGGRIAETLQAVRDQVAVIQPPAWQRFAHGFSHIFAGGYAAGYYSYLWAQVLSADAFDLFEQNGIFDVTTGQAFMQHILQAGGSKDVAELFRDFRGRAPQIDALLRHNGIEQK